MLSRIIKQREAPALGIELVTIPWCLKMAHYDGSPRMQSVLKPKDRKCGQQREATTPCRGVGGNATQHLGADSSFTIWEIPSLVLIFLSKMDDQCRPPVPIILAWVLSKNTFPSFSSQSASHRGFTAHWARRTQP